MTARLMLVCYQEYDVDNPEAPDLYDLFVVANDAAEAVALWRAYYKDNVRQDSYEWSDYTDEDRAADLKKYEDARASWDTKDPHGVWLIPEDELLCRTSRVLGWRKEINEAE